MRLTRLFLVAACVALPLTPAFAPTPAAAQQAPASRALPCAGTVNLVRISDIKPGMMQKFMDAVAAQQAWYKNAGKPDVIGVMRIMEQDATTKSWSFSKTQAITTHTIPPGGTAATHDAAWDAFVAMFADSSTIKTQYTACMGSM